MLFLCNSADKQSNKLTKKTLLGVVQWYNYLYLQTLQFILVGSCMAQHLVIWSVAHIGVSHTAM